MPWASGQGPCQPRRPSWISHVLAESWQWLLAAAQLSGQGSGVLAFHAPLGSDDPFWKGRPLKEWAGAMRGKVVERGETWGTSWAVNLLRIESKADSVIALNTEVPGGKLSINIWWKKTANCLIIQHSYWNFHTYHEHGTKIKTRCMAWSRGVTGLKLLRKQLKSFM